MATWVLGGVGVAGLGVFAGFGLAGRSGQSDLEDRCSPRCSPAEAKSTKTKYLIADIGLGVGVVSLAAATYFALTAPRDATVTARRFEADVVPLPGGAAAMATGRF